MVEWKKLGEICSDIIVPMRDKPKVFDGNIPWCRIEDIEGMYLNKSLSGSMVSDAVIKAMNLKVYPIGTVICSCSATLGVCAINTQPLITNQTFIGLVCSKLVNNRFLYYYMLTRKKELHSLSTTGTIPYVSRAKFEKMEIPIPTLSEQRRIVNILDSFTTSIDNLKQQIEQRKKQYVFYRDQILNLEGKDEVEMKTLGEIGECIVGATPSTKENSYWENGTIPWMSSGEVHQGIVTKTASFITQKGYENASTKMLPEKTIVIALAGQGKTRGTVAITAIKLCTNQSLCGVVVENENIINKYLYFYLKTRYDDLRRISSGDGTRGGLNLSMIRSYYIPIPSFVEQQHIVSILDTFEESIHNMESQLKLREKQYEYYRNKLLTFE